MQRLFVSADPLLVGHLREVLTQHGVSCFVKNAYLVGGAGELPPTECQPELWAEEEDFDRARVILAEVLGTDEPAGSPWRCPRCGETSEAQFAACWNCGAPAP